MNIENPKGTDALGKCKLIDYLGAVAVRVKKVTMKIAKVPTLKDLEKHLNQLYSISGDPSLMVLLLLSLGCPRVL